MSGGSGMKSFAEEEIYVRNEYSEPHFDESSGLPEDELRAGLLRYEKEHEGEPEPLMRAGLYAYLLDNCQIEINEHTPFPEKIRVGIRYPVDNASWSMLEDIANRRYLDALRAGSPVGMEQRDIGNACGACCPDVDVWHICPDWNNILDYGFGGLLKRAACERDRKAAAGMLDEEQAVFYEAVISEYETVLRLTERFIQAALKKGMTDYAASVRRISEGGAESFYDVLVLTRIYLTVQELGRERARSYGPIDAMWYPYAERDLVQGKITKEEICELLRFFMIKTAAEQRFADQPATLRGVGKNGEKAPYWFTELILDVYDSLGIHNPKLQIRVSENTDRDFLRKVLDMVRRGHNSLVLINEETVMKAYEKIGIGRETSWSFLPIGCYEPVIPGEEDARICAAWLNLSKPVELAVTGGENTLDGTHTFGKLTRPDLPDFDSFMGAVYEQLDEMTDMVIRTLNDLHLSEYRANPSPLLSGTITSCMEKGKDIFNGGMNIHNMSLKCFAIGTAVDSILAVKEFVYEKQELTLREFAEILKKDFEGEEALRQRILASKRKWGNGQAEADGIARGLYDFVWRKISVLRTQTGGRYRIGCDSVMQNTFGERQGATPDGRHARACVTKNMRPNNGCERGGITAFIRSVTQLDHTCFCDAAPCDFILHPTAVSGDDGLDAFEGIVRTYLHLGGFCLHGNIVDANTLREAQKEPEKYRNLQVRVCGWNEYFVNMKKELQDDFIARTSGIEAQ